jgi:hypothetical protein
MPKIDWKNSGQCQEAQYTDLGRDTSKQSIRNKKSKTSHVIMGDERV